MPTSSRLFDLERLVVLSPHLDDAALSLGATIARASQNGVEVTVVTVLSGDPESTQPAGEWDLRCGFASAAEAARQRRSEDAEACGILGAEPVWLPYGDEQQAERGGSDDAIWNDLSPLLAAADAVVTPGHPLVHLDHAWLTKLLLARRPELLTGLYVEQPYAANITVGRGYSPRPLLQTARLAASTLAGRNGFAPALPAELEPLDGPVTWESVRPTRRERRLKEQSIRAYASQFGVRRLGRRLLTRIHLYEAATGGEHVGLLAGHG
jgi:LmbE family N-acetylglucosaminyl deacetylase